MADLSIIELAIYGLIGYSGILILMVSTLTNPPKSRSLAGARSIFLMPSVLSMAVLTFLSGIVTTGETITTKTSFNNSTNALITETGTITTQIQLVDPIWNTIHFAFFFVLIVYIVIQIFNIFYRDD